MSSANASSAKVFTPRFNPAKPAFGVLVFLLYLFLLAPLLIVFVVSFASNQYLSFPPEGITLKWYEMLPQESTFMEGMKVSLIVAVIVTLIVLALGVPAALALDRFEFKAKAAVQSFFLSPLLIPSIVLALGMVLLFGPLELNNTYAGIIIGHVAITIPFVIRTTLMSLATTDTSCEAAARILGADSWTVFRRVTLPIIQPGVIAGGIFAFIVSFDQFPISLFLVMPGSETLPVVLFNYMKFDLDGAI
ncbi:MAG: ABC transporter permease, partial [Pseudarthrobacter sp.]